MASFLRSHGVMVGLALALVVAAGAVGGETGHHVVGGDRGWDVASNVAEWSLGEVFRVGDSIWFAYSAADESILELGSREEFDACDLSNPISMYTDGLNEVPLEGEGLRYFASGKPESCKGGLKLHVAVQPKELEAAEGPAAVAVPGSDQVPGAEGPTACGTPSLSVSFLICIGMALLRLFVA